MKENSNLQDGQKQTSGPRKVETANLPSINTNLSIKAVFFFSFRGIRFARIFGAAF